MVVISFTFPATLTGNTKSVCCTIRPTPLKCMSNGIFQLDTQEKRSKFCYVSQQKYPFTIHLQYTTSVVCQGVTNNYHITITSYVVGNTGRMQGWGLTSLLKSHQRPEAVLGCPEAQPLPLSSLFSPLSPFKMYAKGEKCFLAKAVSKAMCFHWKWLPQ